MRFLSNRSHSSTITARLALLCLVPSAVAGLDASCSPGGNFDLSRFTLQLPVGSSASSSKPLQVSSSELSGCQGFTNEFFSTDPTDGSLIMKVQGSPETTQCAHTTNSKHCRSELREAMPSSWSPFASRNRLFGDVKVTQNEGEVVVGQIHIDDKISTKPVCELYYDSKGKLSLGVQRTRNGTQQRSAIDTVPPGQRFTYEIRYENNTLSVSINGKAAKKFSTFSLKGPKSYFKAGNYNQGSGPTTVQFYNITVSHSNADGSSGKKNAVSTVMTTGLSPTKTRKGSPSKQSDMPSSGMASNGSLVTQSGMPSASESTIAPAATSKMPVGKNGASPNTSISILAAILACFFVLLF